MALKYNIPFEILATRAIKRRSKLVNNYHYAPKTGRHGVPCLVQSDSIYCPSLNTRIRIPKDFVAFLELHSPYIVIYWPRNKDHNEITVVIDSKHTRPLQVLYAEYKGRRIVNTDWVIRNSPNNAWELNERTALPVGGSCEEMMVNGKPVVWLVPNGNYLPTLFMVSPWLRDQLQYAMLVVNNAGWKLTYLDTHGEPAESIYLADEERPKTFNV